MQLSRLTQSGFVLQAWPIEQQFCAKQLLHWACVKVTPQFAPELLPLPDELPELPELLPELEPLLLPELPSLPDELPEPLPESLPLLSPPSVSWMPQI